MSISGNLSYGTAEIQVEPDQLLNAANQVQSKVKMMQQSFETINTYISKTNGYWKGEAGDFHREMYAKQQTRTIEAINTLQKRVEELQQLAANYTGAEQQASSLAGQLPDNVIQF